MFWNCEGAFSQEFHRTFKVLIQSYNPSMVILIEPKIIRQIADDFNLKSGFYRSHRIKAAGFW